MNHKSRKSIIYYPILSFLALITIATTSSIADFSSSYGQLETTKSIENDTVASNASEWKNYRNDLLGITFDYPSDWELKENGSKVSISDGSTKFNIVKLDPERNELFKKLTPATGNSETDKTPALEYFTLLMEKTAVEKGKRIIEQSDLTKYKIGGEQTGSFLYGGNGLTNEALLNDYAQRDFITLHKGQGYILAFKDSTLTFDEPETQNILNKIIESIRFVT